MDIDSIFRKRNLTCSRRRLLALVCAVAIVRRADAASETLPLPVKFEPSRDALSDVDIALRMARATHRRVLVEVGGEWCSWCHIMDRFFAANPELKTMRDDRFVWLKVNYSRENANEALLARWPKVAGYPHLFVLDTDGRVLHSQDTSKLEAGKTYDVATFRAFLVDWSPA